MIELASYTSFVEESLKSIKSNGKPSELYDPINYVLDIGGKRIRPILTLLGCELFGGNKEDAINQALAIEIFHNFTLIHDDIMDQAPLRRNQQTVHKKWNDNVAILAGDAMMIQAYQQLAQLDPEKLPEVLSLFNKTAIEVCEGQQLDMNFESADDVTIGEYIEMIGLKTSVLLGCALEIGAIIAGANQNDRKSLYNFGLNIGIAFQIQDDILDLYADPEKFGKQVGGDVIANKKTLLYLTAMSKATKEQIEIAKQLQETTNIELKVRRTKELFDHLKVKEECQERMQDHLNLALDALNSVSVSAEKKQPLLELSNFLMQRES